MPNRDTITTTRKEYEMGVLDERGIPAHPYELFVSWFAEAYTTGIAEPNAFALATVSAAGAPSIRTVLLKEHNPEGFLFYTNYRSRKGLQMGTNRNVAMLFFWEDLERQIRIEGSVVKTSREESTTYFSTRPRSSQLGAIVSSQSSVVSGRDVMERAYTELELSIGEETLQCPEHWGGYRVHPVRYEFWQGRPSRLHDRIVYELDDRTSWRTFRLWP